MYALHQQFSSATTVTTYGLQQSSWPVSKFFVDNFFPVFKISLLYIFFFLICIVGGVVQTGSTRHIGRSLAYCTCPGWLWGWRIWWNEWQGKPKYSQKTSPDAILSTTNPTWPDPGLNPGRRGGKPATNRFSYGAAMSAKLVPTFADREGVASSAQRIPTAVFSVF
jgi:hypothetical protein